MPFSQVKDLIKRTEMYHRRSENYYRFIEDNCRDEKTRLVTSHLAGRERMLKLQLKEFSGKNTHAITERWIQFEPAYDLERYLDELKVDANAGTEHFVTVGRELNRRLIKYYHRMAVMSPTEELRDLFAKLETAELDEQKQLNRVLDLI